MKIHSDNFKKENQINVYDFIRNNVPDEYYTKFMRAFTNWDSTLNMSSYSEGVCWMMLDEAYGN